MRPDRLRGGAEKARTAQTLGAIPADLGPDL